MTSISTHQHEKMVEFANKKTSQVATGDQLQLHDEIRLMQQLYRRYRKQLVLLRGVINEYETVQRRVRMQLRKQQATTRHKKDLTPHKK